MSSNSSSHSNHRQGASTYYQTSSGQVLVNNQNYQTPGAMYNTSTPSAQMTAQSRFQQVPLAPRNNKSSNPIFHLSKFAPTHSLEINQRTQLMMASSQISNPFISPASKALIMEGINNALEEKKLTAKPITKLKRHPAPTQKFHDYQTQPHPSNREIDHNSLLRQVDSQSALGYSNLAPSSSNPALNLLQSMYKYNQSSTKSQQRVPSFTDYQNQTSSQIQALRSSMAYSQSSHQSASAGGKALYHAPVISTNGPASKRYITAANSKNMIQQMESPAKKPQQSNETYDDGGSLSLSDDALSPFKQEFNVNTFGKASVEVIEQLKTHLRAKYSHYSGQEVEQLIFKFLNEYLSMIQHSEGDHQSTQMQTTNPSQPQTTRIDNHHHTDSPIPSHQMLPLITLDDEDNQKYTERSSMSSVLDWNDKDKIERQIRKQLQTQEPIQRLSEYFGAIKVDSLDEDEKPDKKLNNLFVECFGMRLGPEEEVSEDENLQKQGRIQNFNDSHVNHGQKVQHVNEPKKVEEQKKPRKANNSSSQPPQQNIMNSSGNMKDVIVQQNTVNNDQSCQIIVNFYNVECQSPPQDTPYVMNSSQTPCTQHMTTGTSNDSVSISQPIPVNKSRLSKILNSQNSIKVSQFKKTISPRQGNVSTVQSHGLTSVALSTQGKHLGSNPLTIEDQQMIFDSDDGNSRPSDERGNFSIPGEFNGLRITPKQAIKKVLHQSTNAAARIMLSDSHPNFGSIIEQQQRQSPYQSFEQTNSAGGHHKTHTLQQNGPTNNNNNLSLQKQLHQTTKLFFKSILYKNQMMSISHVNKAVTDQHSPQDLKIQSSYNSLQFKKKSVPGANSGTSLNGSFKSKKLAYLDSKFVSDFIPSGSRVNHQKMHTATSTGTLATSMNNESLESIHSKPAKQNCQQVKAQKIGSIISMKALKNDLISQGIYSGMNPSQASSNNRQQYMTQYAQQKQQAQGNILHKRPPSRNYALMPPNQYTEVIKRQFKSTEDSSFSPQVIKVETKKQISSRNNHRVMHHTHSHQSSVHSIDHDEEGKSSIGNQSRNITQYSQTRLGSPKLSKRSMNHKKRLIISPNHLQQRQQANYYMTSSDLRPESLRNVTFSEQKTNNSVQKSGSHQLIRETPRQQISQKQKYLGNANNLKHGSGQSRNQNIKDRTNSQIYLTVSTYNLPVKPPKRYLSPGMSQVQSLQEQKFQAIQKVYANQKTKNPSHKGAVNLSSTVQNALVMPNASNKALMQKSLSRLQTSLEKNSSPRHHVKESFTVKNTYRKNSKDSVPSNKGSQVRKQIQPAQSVPVDQQIHVKIISQFKPDAYSPKNQLQQLQSKKKNSVKPSAASGKNNVTNATNSLINVTLSEERSQERMRVNKQSNPSSMTSIFTANPHLIQTAMSNHSRSGHISNQLSGGSISESLKKTLKNVKVLQYLTNKH